MSMKGKLDVEKNNSTSVKKVLDIQRHVLEQNSFKTYANLHLYSLLPVLVPVHTHRPVAHGLWNDAASQLIWEYKS